MPDHYRRCTAPFPASIQAPESPQFQSKAWANMLPAAQLMPSSTTFARVSRVASRMYGRLFSANPYPLYKFLRTRYPLMRTPIGFWISTRYADCHSVLRDKRFLAFDLNALDSFPPDDGLKSMREALQHAIVFRNPPDHTRLRRLMTTFFSPREDLISIMVAAEGRGDLQTEEELVFSAMFTLLAGHETTMNMIGNGMLALFRNPDALARLRSDPSLIESALDEFLRFDSPVQVTFRTASEDIELAGRMIPRREHVVVFLGAANRDPARFANPDQLDITRTENHHLSFAAGPHRCIGEVLAKVEGRIAFETILRRMPKLALADPNPRWRPAMSLRGLESLPLTF